MAIKYNKILFYAKIWVYWRKILRRQCRRGWGCSRIHKKILLGQIWAKMI